MTTYPTADHADMWAAYKQPKAETTAGLSYIVRDMFRLLDDLQRITYDGCDLDNADIGAIQAKLSILRINLNVHHGVHTEQLHDRPKGLGMAASVG
jgi:hypothetical protein